MAIAGIEPVGHLANTVGDLTIGTDMYTDYQLRHILERYDEWIQYVGNDDVTGFMEFGEE